MIESPSAPSGLIDEIRSKFAHVDTCPVEGPRIFFENAGGALTLNSVVQTTAHYAAIPDNQGRDNPMSKELQRVINKAKQDARVFLNVQDGDVFVGESGTELLFRLIRNAVIAAPEGGNVVGTSLEHPASRSAAQHWAEQTGRPYLNVPHNNETGSVDAAAYEKVVTPETRVATIIHTSPVSGMGVDVAAIAKSIRAVSPDCLIIVDGIQHAAHGGLDLGSYQIDGYAISAYKMFSRHGYGLAWAGPRLTDLPHENLKGGPVKKWELGTRDTGAYATFSDVIAYFEWLGEQFTDETDQRAKIEAAGKAIHAHEKDLTDAMLHGIGNLPGLADLKRVTVIGGIDNPLREGLVAITLDGMESGELVEQLRQNGIRVHIRKADHYSGNILDPLGLPSCVRVSMCHYNSKKEVGEFLAVMKQICEASS